MNQVARKLHPSEQLRSDPGLQTPDMSGNGNDKIDLHQAVPVTVDADLLKENRILTGFEPYQFRESYNFLRTQILHRFRQHNWQVLAVTSPDKGEGTSLTAINLAISVAREIAYSVLLVDANLHQPVMLDYFGIPERRGLSDYLTGDVPVDELLVKPDHYDGLVILPGGRPLEGSAEMLNSPKMKRLVREMRTPNDNHIVIFDLPPVLFSTDTLSFASQTDAALLVVEDGFTQRQNLECAVERLGNTSIVGTVLNKCQH